MAAPSIFKHESAREFLRHYLDSLPRRGWGEVQRWADQLGVQPSLVSQILSGAKNLNVDQALKLSHVLGLTGIELDYFVLLVERERAGAHQAKDYFSAKLKALKKESADLSKRVPRDRDLSSEEQAVFYSSWIYSAIRLYCSTQSGLTLDRIAKRFGLSRQDCALALDFLCDTGLCIEKNGKYAVGTQKTHVDRRSPHVKRHWMNWHVKAIAQFDNATEDDIVYSAPFSISDEDLEALREELRSLIKAFVARVQTTKPQKLAYLNLDLIEIP